ncbi:WD40-repeat-containing domain protein [Pelagophyceae sp. CCMP2097]|nr:WD40-repeat-containing domain protein [Pelagophyceae sp. CCMP2097]
MATRSYTKDELFGGSARGSARSPRFPGDAATAPRFPGDATAESKGESKGEEKRYDGPLELEHVIGYTGAHPRTFLALPRARDHYVKAMGSIVVLGDINDPHAQKLLRAHDEPVTAMAVAVGGDLVASGQRGSTKIPGAAAPVVLWSAQRLGAVSRLEGLTRGCSLLEFSDDERFLAAAGEDGLLYIWDTATGEVAFGKRFAKPLALLMWVGHEARGRRRAYRLCVGVAGTAEVEHCDLAFDATRQQWSLSTAAVQMPTAGMARLYHCSAVVNHGADEKYLLAGTSEGDLVVMRLAVAVETREDQKRSGGVFRASISVCTGGLTAVAHQPGNDGEAVVFCGGGDGCVRRLVGRDMRWRVEASVALEGVVTSISFAGDAGEELLVGTDAGRTYRLLAGDVSQSVQLSAAHVGRPTCVGFGSRADVFATASDDGACVVWDLGDYSALAVAEQRRAPQLRGARDRGAAKDFGGGARCLAWVTDVAVLVGYNDAHVRCFSAADGAMEWEIAGAHRAPVSAIACWVEPRLAYLVTGADDGGVRVWNLATRAVMMEFGEHTKAVATLAVDVRNPRLFHSAARDCAVFTHDVQLERRTVSHIMRDGAFTGLSQRIDSEQELVTCDANGRVLMWDCDVADPVLGVTVDARRVESVAVSPSGRFLALCRDELVTIFQLGGNDLKPIAEGWAHSDVARAAKWSPDEKQLVSVGDDHCICVWNFFAD